MNLKVVAIAFVALAVTVGAAPLRGFRPPAVPLFVQV